MYKVKKIKISTVKGERTLMFQPFYLNTQGVACNTVCPYGIGVCTRLRNPSNPDDPEQSFTDFCSDIDRLVDAGLHEEVNYIPCRGTLEENLYDVENIYEVLIDDNGFFRVNDLIDSYCPEMCGLYSPDHKNCSHKNTMCILQGFLKNLDFDPEKYKECNCEDKEDE